MLFAGPDGTILSLHENAVPLDETVIDGGQGIQYVLEINAGMAARLGIKTGDILQHPAFGDQAIGLLCLAALQICDAAVWTIWSGFYPQILCAVDAKHDLIWLNPFFICVS